MFRFLLHVYKVLCICYNRQYNKEGLAFWVCSVQTRSHSNNHPNFHSFKIISLFCELYQLVRSVEWLENNVVFKLISNSSGIVALFIKFGNLLTKLSLASTQTRTTYLPVSPCWVVFPASGFGRVHCMSLRLIRSHLYFIKRYPSKI